MEFTGVVVLGVIGCAVIPDPTVGLQRDLSLFVCQAHNFGVKIHDLLEPDVTGMSNLKHSTARNINCYSVGSHHLHSTEYPRPHTLLSSLQRSVILNGMPFVYGGYRVTALIFRALAIAVVRRQAIRVCSKKQSEHCALGSYQEHLLYNQGDKNPEEAMPCRTRAATKFACARSTIVDVRKR